MWIYVHSSESGYLFSPRQPLIFHFVSWSYVSGTFGCLSLRDLKRSPLFILILKRVTRIIEPISNAIIVLVAAEMVAKIARNAANNQVIKHHLEGECFFNGNHVKLSHLSSNSQNLNTRGGDFRATLVKGVLKKHNVMVITNTKKGVRKFAIHWFPAGALKA